jgi:hypothetical protein
MSCESLGLGVLRRLANPGMKLPRIRIPRNGSLGSFEGDLWIPQETTPLFPGAKSQIYLGIFEGVDPSIAAAEAGLGGASEACRRDPRGLLKTTENGFAVPEDTLALAQKKVFPLGSFDAQKSVPDP